MHMKRFMDFEWMRLVALRAAARRTWNWAAEASALLCLRVIRAQAWYPNSTTYSGTDGSSDVIDHHEFDPDDRM